MTPMNTSKLKHQTNAHKSSGKSQCLQYLATFVDSLVYQVSTKRTDKMQTSSGEQKASSRLEKRRPKRRPEGSDPRVLVRKYPSQPGYQAPQTNPRLKSLNPQWLNNWPHQIIINPLPTPRQILLAPSPVPTR